MTTENYLSHDCPRNGKLVEKDKIQCDKCTKLDCYLKLLSALDSLVKMEKPMIFDEEDATVRYFSIDIQVDFSPAPESTESTLKIDKKTIDVHSKE